MRISYRRDDRLREEIHEAVLPNGLRALFLPKRGFRRKIAVFAARYGSIDLTFRAGDGAFQHALDCLFGDDDPLAEAESRQPAGAGHFIG